MGGLKISLSRLIFLNLPSSIQPDSFKLSLSKPKSLSSCTITDLKLVPKRRFAFVGYKKEDEAQKVKDWFDGSFEFGGGKVKVDFVRDDPLAPKPPKESKSKSTKPIDGSDESQPTAGPSKRLQEFMDVMKGGDPSSSTSTTAPTMNTNAVPGEQGWIADGQITKTEKSKKGKEKSIEPEEGSIVNGLEGEDDDAAWMRRRQNAQIQGEGESSTSISKPDEDLILSTGRLFIRNLAFIVTSSELKEHFERFGKIDEIHLPISSTTGEPLGTAFIQFHQTEDALKAYKVLDKSTFQGRLLHILPGRSKPGQISSVGTTIDGKVLGKKDELKGEIKRNVDEKRKEESRKGVNWATLYMNSDAVAASVASRMGINKSELLNSESGNSAVKLALAETTVIEETKKYFENAGINLDSLKPKVPRSQTIILVKNIPFGTSIQTLTDLFSQFGGSGSLKRVLLPPSGTLGVIEFENPQESNKAFKSLSYRRLGNSVIYLEKGPINMFKEGQNYDPKDKPISTLERELQEQKALMDRFNEINGNGDGGDNNQNQDQNKLKGNEMIREVADENDESGSTLFLKNLNFSTTTEKLNSVLKNLPGFSFCRVQIKNDPKRPNEKLSMGYGFVGFKTKKEAEKGLKVLENFEIDNKILQVKFAQRGSDEDDRRDNRQNKDNSDALEGGGKTKSTKLLVKNLPFEISKKEVRELFSSYGQVKSLRLPRKSIPSSNGSNSTRGFAFLEFTTHTEALRAKESLKHTHLLGRHLVLEWAKQNDDVDLTDLREKVGRDVKFLSDDQGGRQGKRRKLDFSAGAGASEDMDGLDME
ncbi:uncharacterized protein L201_003037 [Kwoniella dendrophila CBS 6074]|uniref:RRM domain-containing protein n=1 Tax=Kwoniella dendrophila CBS 6074 TaxID=1295534 RepID=A0AAX4JTL2_9TREE